MADIGTDERIMEGLLQQWFARGASWGAIILIDEADVFLEKRQVKDLRRNSLVSGKICFLPPTPITSGHSLINNSISVCHGILHRNALFGTTPITLSVFDF